MRKHVSVKNAGGSIFAVPGADGRGRFLKDIKNRSNVGQSQTNKQLTKTAEIF